MNKSDLVEFFAKLQNHIYKLQRGRPKKTVEWACVQLIQKTLMYMTWLYKRVIKWERMCETLVRQWQWQSVWLQNHSRLFLRARSFTKANDNSNNWNEELKKKINRNLYEVLAFFHYHIMGYEFCNQPREGVKEKLYLWISREHAYASYVQIRTFSMWMIHFHVF